MNCTIALLDTAISFYNEDGLMQICKLEVHPLSIALFNTLQCMLYRHSNNSLFHLSFHFYTLNWHHVSFSHNELYIHF
jgi:hypothetical protein